MTREARLMSGIILITVPTIQYGGYFLLTSLMSKGSGYMENPLRQNFFRAGHAHAGVWVVLSLVIQVLLDSAALSPKLKWLARVAAPLAAVAISGGFFGLAYSSHFTWLLYFGAGCLVVVALLTGIGLLRSPNVTAQRGGI